MINVMGREARSAKVGGLAQLKLIDLPAEIRDLQLGILIVVRGNIFEANYRPGSLQKHRILNSKLRIVGRLF